MKTLWLGWVVAGCRLLVAQPYDGSERELRTLPPPLQSAVSNAHGLFGITVSGAMRLRFSGGDAVSPAHYGFRSPHLSADFLSTDGFIYFASDLVAAKLGYERRTSPSNGRPATSQPNVMEAKARETAARLGVKLTDDHKNWDGQRLVKENYKPKEQVWTFLWHRYYGGVPVWNDYIILTLDDATGKLLYFTSMARPYRYERELKPVVPLEEARAKAIKHYVARHPGSRYEDPGKTTMGTYEKTLFFYYVQEELRPEKLKLLKDPRDDQKLRLCYAIYVGYWEKGEEKKPLSINDLVMVDAVTGEEVVRNPID